MPAKCDFAGQRSQNTAHVLTLRIEVGWGPKFPHLTPDWLPWEPDLHLSTVPTHLPPAEVRAGRCACPFPLHPPTQAPPLVEFSPIAHHTKQTVQTGAQSCGPTGQRPLIFLPIFVSRNFLCLEIM